MESGAALLRGSGGVQPDLADAQFCHLVFGVRGDSAASATSSGSSPAGSLSTLLQWSGLDRGPLEVTLYEEANFEAVGAQEEMLQLCRSITDSDSPLHLEARPLCLYSGLERWVNSNRSAICNGTGI